MHSAQLPLSRSSKHSAAAATTIVVLGILPVAVGYAAAYRTGPVQDGWLYFNLFCSFIVSGIVTGMCIVVPMLAAERIFANKMTWQWFAAPVAAVATVIVSALYLSLPGQGDGYSFATAIQQTCWYGMIGAVVYAATISYVQWRQDRTGRNGAKKQD